jgi:hypothetical protein
MRFNIAKEDKGPREVGALYETENGRVFVITKVARQFHVLFENGIASHASNLHNFDWLGTLDNITF